MSALNIAIIGPATSCPEGWQRYPGVDALLAAPPADILVLGGPSTGLDAALLQLRRDSRYALRLIYTAKQQTPGHPLADGPVPDDSQLLEQAYRRWQTQLASFNRGRLPERLEEYVLAWLWLRPHAELAPRRNPADAQIYHYPLIQAFADGEPVNETLWLRLMVEQDLLSANQLVDRIRLCTQCNSAHLNYVDVCPACKALDIAKQPALHCFTCGHVAPQEHFLKDGLLLCPNCLTKLRHIGSDYDRPLENQSCRSCRAAFMDADVQARCLDCGHQQAPDALRVREIRRYSITEKGRLRCRQGLDEAFVRQYFSRLNLISLEDFNNLLDWQIQQSRRYLQSPPCSLLAFQFVGLEQLLEQPAGQAALDSLLERIEQAIRDTDRCTRSREDLLWFMLPHTDAQGMRVFWERMVSLTQLVDAGPVKLGVRVAGLTLPAELMAEETAALLMARLAGELH